MDEKYIYFNMAVCGIPLVIAVQLYRNHISLHHLFDYYPCYTTEHGQWILYTVTGMIVPLFIGAVTDFIESIPKKY